MVSMVYLELNDNQTRLDNISQAKFDLSFSVDMSTGTQALLDV